MDFALPPELEAWQQEVRALVTSALQPHDDVIEATGTIPPEALAALRRAGLFGINTPVEYGGLGHGMLGTALAVAELAKAHVAYYYTAGVNVHIGSKAIELAGTEEQRRRWLPGLASGDVIGAFALSEREAGSDAGAIGTTATGDGAQYRLDGEKRWITNAPVAGLFTVFARTSEAPGPRGLTAFVVEAGTPGLRVGAPHELTAGNGSGHAPVVFDGCVVPADQRLGAEGEGFPIAMRCLDAGRVAWSAYCVGAGERLLGLALDHVGRRRQFGRPLADFQGLQWRLADMAADLHAARLVCYDAAWRYDQEPARRRPVAAMAKLVGADMVGRLADATLQLLGGTGYSRESPVERIWRESRVVRILDGTSEIMRTIVARDLIAGDRART